MTCRGAKRKPLANSSTAQLDDNDKDRDHGTMSKLFAFQSCLGGGSPHDDGAAVSNNTHGASSQDSSLAARMARRAQLDDQQKQVSG